MNARSGKTLTPNDAQSEAPRQPRINNAARLQQFGNSNVSKRRMLAQA
jgi:hypothetical protein